MLYYLYIGLEYVEVDEQFFKDLVDLYSTKFEIIKCDKDSLPKCQSNMILRDELYYCFRDFRDGRLILFGKLVKVVKVL